jgi:hypothetical protein
MPIAEEADAYTRTQYRERDNSIARSDGLD